MKSLKEKTVDGVFWSFIQNFSTQINAFIVGIILARLLTPRDFGLIGMLTIFIALSGTLINSGFIDALIRKPDATETDYSTAFFFNVAMSLVLYAVLFFGADVVSSFFEEPRLVTLLQVLGLTVVINAFTLIQRAKLTKELNFKLLTKVEVIASGSAGIVAIGMAYTGFGVWSLVAKTLLMSFFTVILFWVWSKWIPKLTFNKESFKGMFSFGSRLAALGIIDTIYNNVYYLIIGKYYTAGQLGHYTKAESFKNFPSKGITGIVQKVSYPVLSEIQDDPERLKGAYRKLTKIISLVTLTLLFGLSAIAENFTIFLLGDDWKLTGEFLKILCFAAMFYPLNALNMNIMKVKGRSGLILNIGILKKVFAVPVIVIAIFFDLKLMLIAMIIQQFITYYINTFFGGKLISYSIKEQLQDIFPGLLVSAVMFIMILPIPNLITSSIPLLLAVEILFGAIIAIGLYEIFKVDGYIYLKEELIKKL